MSYITTVSVYFLHPRSEVYAALCDLGKYSLWNSGMTDVSYPGVMYEGLRYQTKTVVAGRTNEADIEVVRLVPDKEIELNSEAGLIAFRAMYILHDTTDKSCEITCSLRFEFNKLVLYLARPAIEAMAQARLRGDLETLAAMLQADHTKQPAG